MPGQTEFALCLHGMIDGRRVAFTGDNLFGDPDDPSQTGHEAVVAHNSAILEEGYILGAEFLKRLRPDLLIGGHSFVMDRPAKFIERFRTGSYEDCVAESVTRHVCPLGSSVSALRPGESGCSRLHQGPDGSAW